MSNVITQIETPLGKIKDTGDLLGDIAHEIENYTGDKLLSLAPSLGDKMGLNGFCIGGIALRIKEESLWAPAGFSSFEDYVNRTFGYSETTANRFIVMYHNLVNRQIPWQKVKDLGWVKVLLLSKVLTLDNIDDWVAKAESLTVPQLKGELKGENDSKGNGSLGGAAPPKHTESLQNPEPKEIPVPVKVKGADKVIADIEKSLAASASKPPVPGSHPLSGSVIQTNTGKPVAADMPHGKPGMVSEVKAAPDDPSIDIAAYKDMVKRAGWKFSMSVFGELFPEIDITVSPTQTGTA